jgi:hypothetical protein
LTGSTGAIWALQSLWGSVGSLVPLFRKKLGGT